jgi:hypothetical protein
MQPGGSEIKAGRRPDGTRQLNKNPNIQDLAAAYFTIYCPNPQPFTQLFSEI